MKNNREASKVLCLIACCLLHVACTSFKSVSTDDIEAEIEVGDTLRVTTNEGALHQFDFSGVEEGVLLGADDPIPLEDIRVLEKRELSLVPNLALGAAAAVVVFVIVTMTVF